MRKDFIFTSESVSEGHPDKVSDRISDMVVDHFIAKDPFARVACETLTTTNKVVLAGEVRGPVEEDKDEIVSKVRECIKDIGYEQELQEYAAHCAGFVLSLLLWNAKSSHQTLGRVVFDR